MKVTDMMADDRPVFGIRRSRDWYVVCSEACGATVTRVLRSIKLSTNKDFEVCLGVDRLVLSGDVIEMTTVHLW